MKTKIIIILMLIMGTILCINKNRDQQNVVNIYGWYGVFPQSVIKQFEKETGIKVVFDAFDNNNMLEAKLISGASGYDIVFPSFIPYGSRQITMGVYSKLDYSLIPNASNIDGNITNKFKQNKGNTDYLLPMFWGTIGIAYDSNIIKKLFPLLKTFTYTELMSSEYMREISKYGVSFPEEYIDIFPQIQVLLNNDYSLQSVISMFEPIRKYITKFNSSTVIYDLLSGQICMAICSSDHAYKIMKSVKIMHSTSNSNKNIVFSTPIGSTPLWIDCIAIPNTAQNKINAHKFINFILQPQIAAEITNYSGILVNIPKASKCIDEDIKCNSNIYPQDEMTINAFIMGHPIRNENDRRYDKEANKIWMEIKINQHYRTKNGEKYD